MKIVGIEKNSFVDYSGKIVACLFTQGCNMNCSYCHNRSLLSSNNDAISNTEIFDFLKNRRGFLDGVVISGGEPTIQEDLEEFLYDIKALGFLIKLDTNGTNPDMLETLINKGLIDYVAMDIKAPFNKYEEICNSFVPINKIKRSISLLLEGRVDYEFRTTLDPSLNHQDILDISEKIKGCRVHVLQQCRNEENMRINYDSNYINKILGNSIYSYETRGF